LGQAAQGQRLSALKASRWRGTGREQDGGDVLVAEAAELDRPLQRRPDRVATVAAFQLEHPFQLEAQTLGAGRGGCPQVAFGRLAELQEAHLGRVARAQWTDPGRDRLRVVIVVDGGSARRLQPVQSDLAPLVYDANLIAVD
jgi:hypothetical protein